MAKFVNVYPGTLVLPSGEEIASGASVEISADLAKNAGVADWIESGYLAKPGAVKVAPSEDLAGIKVELADANAAVDRLTAELDAERAKTADLEAKLAEATAALEAATKPADPPQA